MTAKNSKGMIVKTGDSVKVNGGRGHWRLFGVIPQCVASVFPVCLECVASVVAVFGLKNRS
jgi:hypothetical protein